MSSLDDVRERTHGYRAEPDGDLPRPTSERWQPLRLGLVDLFYYDDEQFWFHDGRLLLRGNNGTGKSKVLALTLPFLLDGSIAPRRVEPDADPKKRMEWNLLLGGAHQSSERTGYSWAEFGRVDADGTEHFTTLGIGVKAAAGRGIVKTWYFTSARRIGDLRLLDGNRTVLSQERLRDELTSTGSGQVYATQETYRRAVDEAMFRLGEERYAALIDLLIQLRQPQLSKKPDEKVLSAALTEALAPLDQAVVADVAESFRSLEDERAGIAEAKETLAAAEGFLRHYRVYARVASRRHTTAVRLANSAYEHAGRDLRDAEERLRTAGNEVERLAGLHEAATERQSVLQGQEHALRESPEMRDADRLDRASREATETERRAVAAGIEAEQAATRAQQEIDGEAAAAGRHEASVRESEQHEATAARLAGAAGLRADHAAISADADAARRALTRRREQLAHVRRVVEAVQQAESSAAQQRQLLDAAEAAVAGRVEGRQAAHEALEAAVAAYRDGVRDHLAGLTAIVLDTGVDELVEQAEGWALSMFGEPPARSAVEAAATQALTRIERERAEAAHTEERLADELAQLRTEIADLEAGHDPEPPPVPARDRRAREDRDGAPLWRLTDFAGSVTDTDRAGVEAALQSAGLLDAWIFPDGTVRAGGEVVLGPNGPEVATSLAAVLIPAAGPDDAVGADAVLAVLDRIGWGEASGADLWVDWDGSWGAGPARGAWGKERAEFVGAGAREAHRHELLATLRTRAEELETGHATAHERVAEAERQAGNVRTERAGYPGRLERGLGSAHDRVAAANLELERAQQEANEAHETWERAAEVAEKAAEELAEQAVQLGVPTTVREIDVALAAVATYAEALVELRSAARALADAAAARDQAAARAAEAVELRERQAAEHKVVRTQAAGLRSRYEALRATVGASVAELQARLGETTAALGQVADELKRIAKDELAAAARHGSLEEKVSDLGRRREETAALREEKIDALRAFAGTGLLRVAVPDLLVPAVDDAEGWNVTAALSLSRTAEQQLSEVDESDDAWGRAQQRVSSASTELSAQMSRHGHTAFVEQRGDVLVVRVLYLHDEVDVDRLADRLAEDVADRERLLSAREREILENHLVNEVAGHLHELLLTAEGQIDRMNRELADRKTATGMQLRVRWRERGDGPAGLVAARDLMIRSDATWTPGDRTAIGDFLQAQIAEVRQNDPAGGWQEHLEQALDYRQWHTFVVERWQNGQWRSASGPASGGERALAVSVPLFAAASAHYNSAGPHAPRLILLDEAFAGVDDDSRAKSLGLLATFDLDVVMTSEREWACYPEVPGISIAQLSRVEGVDAVGVTRWRWDGRRRHRSAEVDAAARAGSDSPASSHDATLFG
ncbi:TIGR02680 family protein [Georgenia subflava]|uniref:TIGR02680 family protein n=1 Tax=Georgenia subflava TaxID=1622177 RepID=A0A6N7ENV0_9MICO|nr:TIGR02680 family protein [Georgenia subflava]MPV37816.1 TIGR02680 family protein [Georgenia subflava]